MSRAEHFTVTEGRAAALSVLMALLITVALGAVMFESLGISPGRGLWMFFIQPWLGANALSELALKATPLLLIALGLGLCFRAQVWNIGAEGQFILGAIAASGVAMQAGPQSSGLWVLGVLLAGAAGGALWALVVALLRVRFQASEILVSLMLVYVAGLLLGYLVQGPWRDPAGHNFPHTITFEAAAMLPRLLPGLRANVGSLLALVLALGMAGLMFRTRLGLALQVGGMAPAAARMAGFSASASVMWSLGLSGALAGLAGAMEVAGPVGQLTQHVPTGAGFVAIIVAFLGRLHPLGMVCSALLMSMLAVGAELSQSRLGLPPSMAGVFQGLMLISLLVCDAWMARGGLSASAQALRRLGQRLAPSLEVKP